jgi:glycosyltransferase involved in cell wall biosynthesis
MVPRVSVCIPVFNRKDIVLRAVESALQTSVADLELVVVDNNSDDGTWEKLQQVDDKRLRLFRNERNIGMFGNFNRSAAVASGKNILFLCSDDRLSPGFIEHALKLLSTWPNVSMVSGRGRYKNQDGVTLGWEGGVLLPGIYRGSSIKSAFFWYMGSYGTNIFNYPSGMLIRREALDFALPFRSDVGAPADIDLFLRCMERGDLLVTDHVGCEILVHDTQTGRLNKDAGTHIDDLLRLARFQLAQAGNASDATRFRRQMGASVAFWSARKALKGDFAAALSASKFGIGWGAIFLGLAYRLFYRGLRAVGIVIRPYAAVEKL